MGVSGSVGALSVSRADRARCLAHEGRNEYAYAQADNQPGDNDERTAKAWKRIVKRLVLRDKPADIVQQLGNAESNA